MRRHENSRGIRISSSRISAAGTRKGPKTFGSLKSPSALPIRVKTSWPGYGTIRARLERSAEMTAPTTYQRVIRLAIEISVTVEASQSAKMST